MKKIIKNTKSILKNKSKYMTLLLNKKVVILMMIISTLILMVHLVVLRNSEGFLMDGVLGGNENSMTEQQILEQLQKNVEDSMFRVKVNERPSMNVNTGATSILVQNSVENTFNKKVKYYNHEGELIYETRELYPGDVELSADFEGEWDMGEYQLVADIVAIDKELNEEFVVTTMDIILTVKEKN